MRRAPLLIASHETVRGLAVVLDRRQRPRATARIRSAAAALRADARSGSPCARGSARPSARAAGSPHRAGRRESRPRRSSRARLPVISGSRRSMTRGRLDVPAGETRLGCDLEQPPRARVVALVQRVPVAGDRAARRDEFSEHGARAGFEVARRAREHVVEAADPPLRPSRESPNRSRVSRPPPRPAAPPAPPPGSAGWPARSARARARRWRPASRRARAAATGRADRRSPAARHDR